MIILPMITFLSPQKVNYLTLLPLVGTALIINFKDKKKIL